MIHTTNGYYFLIDLIILHPLVPDTSIVVGEISRSHGREYEDDCLLGCCAV
jgi:hypothetical protein